MEKPATHQIRETALELLKKNPDGITWSELNKMIEKKHPDFHPKTFNGTVWKLVETYPDEVYKPRKGLFKLRKYK